MEVYIEYAFMENFLFDGVLLCLAQKATRAPIRWGKTALAAVCGGVFALVFPVLALSSFWTYVLRFAVGFLLCFLVSDRLKSRKEWGRYAFTVVWFFVFTFGFGGALTAMIGTEQRAEQTPTAYVMAGFCFLTLFSMFFIRKLYAKRAVARFLYDCKAMADGKEVQLVGFFDSGNLVQKNGLPVCFLSMDIFYDLFGEEILKEGGHVRDEIIFQTLNGERKTRIYKGVLVVKTPRGAQKKEVYFAPSANIISREYQMIIPADVLNENMF